MNARRIGVLLLASLAFGQDEPAAKPKPLTPGHAADEVVAAFKGKHTKALEGLAERNSPDPWLVADELCSRGEHEAAGAFAKAAPRRDTEKLPAYVTSRRGKPTNAEASKALAAAHEAKGPKDWKAALAALEVVDAMSDDLVSVRLLHARGHVLRSLRRLEESAKAYLVAAGAAERLGWLARAATALHESGMSEYYRSNSSGALAAWERRLAIEKSRANRAGVARTLGNIGNIHVGVGSYQKALDYQKRSLELNEELGDRAGVARVLGNIGTIHRMLGSYAKALDYQERSRQIREKLGDRAGVAATLGSIGNIHTGLGSYREALDYYERSLEVLEELGDPVGTARALANIGNVHSRLGSYAKALDYQRRAHQLMLKLGDRAGVAATLGSIGNIHQKLGSYAKALDYQKRSLRLEEKLGDRAGVARSLGNIGGTHVSLGAYEKALDYHERSLMLMEGLGDRAGVATVLGNIGLVHSRRGSYAKALDYQERSLRLKEELGDRPGVAATLKDIGVIHRSLGFYTEALDYQERSLRLMVALGDRAGVAETLQHIGIIHSSLCAYAKALDYLERSLKASEELGDRAGVSRTLGEIGSVHRRIGSYRKALEYQERSLELGEELGDRAGVATTLANIGIIHASLGSYGKALEHQKRSLELMEELGDRASVATTLGNIGVLHASVGSYGKALDSLEQSLKLSEGLGSRAGVAAILGNLGTVHLFLGSHGKARDYYERARVMARELGSVWAEVKVLSNLASVHLALGKPAEAVRAARSGVEKLPLLVEGLAEEQGATARDQWTGLLEKGVNAGMQIEDVAEVCFFLESGRAGVLLESLGGRNALGSAAIPDGLLREERAARASLHEARALLGAALKSGKRMRIRAARADLEASQGRMLDAVAKIQRAAKATADVTYPKAAPLDKIQAALAPSEALVSFAVLSKETVALVVTRINARVVRLARHEDTLRLDDPKRPWEVQAARFREAVVEPLGLGKETTRLLVASAGTLSYVPFSVLAPEFEVVYVPSGTTYTVLRAERTKRGKGVLALGNPDYTTRRGSSVYGAGFAPLPGTQAEAKAVGDVVLLDKHATEATLLSAVRGAKRWRAVHLACHGLMNAQQPQLSSLALTPDHKNDGFLTVLEVFRMKIPADLVVLSACETGKGKVYNAEGIIGFTRAFMLAGAPRVIVSLWKVDDQATQALMKKFYELWKPGKMATAKALREAQEFVRSHDRWKHPYYWAAWQLWGLPD